MAFIHIKSNQAGLVFIDGKPMGELNEKNRFCLDFQISPSSFMLFALPTTKTLPITTLVNLNCCKNNSDDIQIIPFFNNHFDIFLNWSKTKSMMPTKELAYFSTNERSISIYNNGTSYICAYQNGSLKNSIELSIEFSKASIEEIGNKYCIVLENNNYRHAVVLDEQLQVLFNGEISVIENSANTISFISPLHDLFGHCQVYKIGEKVEKYFVYEENAPKYVPASLNALALFQCIKIGNMTLAKDLLSIKIKNKAENLKEYVGHINNIYYNQYCTNIQNYTIESSDTFKSFSVVTDNGMIKDIYEEDFTME